ncbi:unnamed protein product [Rotaria sordida]|uniref:VASt domain-containing protein n=1 Tax=Rotaria sordida TaxID=392033 RepID=A0A814R5C1_9BILA|nr:unnamed protein product [Rotaria sordida]
MSHNHLNEEVQGTGISNNDHTIRRRNSNNHLNLKPTTVIDHIKTKVKRRRASHNNTTETFDSPKDNNTKQINREQNKSEPKFTTITVHSQPNRSSQTLLNQYSDDTDENKFNETNNLSIEKNENNINVYDQIDKDANTNETVQWQIDQIEVDIDNHQRKTRTKSYPESISQSNTKKRHQTARCKNSQIHDEDLNNIFSDLPSNEQLIVAYPCAWRKDILMHGRMFLSVNYICFHTCFLKWKESLCIAYKDILSVKRAKSAKVLPNAIKLRTKNHEQYYFASYIPRERIFITVFRLWQNALLEQPLNYEQLRAIIFADKTNIDASSEDSEGSIEGERNREYPPNRRRHPESVPSILPSHSKKSPAASTASDQEMISSSPNEQQINYPSICPCETHLAKTFGEQLLSFDIDTLFELTFGDNSFIRAYRDSQKLLEYTIGEWHINNETGKRERQVTYKTINHSFLGTNTISCNEKQIIEAEKPHLLYVIRTDVYNEGMKYTDAFYVSTQFCMLQRDAEHSSLRVSAEIKYIKNINVIAKSFIDKLSNASLEGGINNLICRLKTHQHKINNRESNRKQTTSILKQHQQQTKDSCTSQDEKKNDIILDPSLSSEDQIITNEQTITEKNLLFKIIFFFGIFLLILHTYLCYKLYSIDQALSTPNLTCLNQSYLKHICRQ